MGGTNAESIWPRVTPSGSRRLVIVDSPRPELTAWSLRGIRPLNLDHAAIVSFRSRVAADLSPRIAWPAAQKRSIDTRLAWALVDREWSPSPGGPLDHGHFFPLKPGSAASAYGPPLLGDRVVPTLIVCAPGDFRPCNGPESPAPHGSSLKDGPPRSHPTVFRNAGHWSWEDNPKRFFSAKVARAHCLKSICHSRGRRRRFLTEGAAAVTRKTHGLFQSGGPYSNLSKPCRHEPVPRAASNVPHHFAKSEPALLGRSGVPGCHHPVSSVRSAAMRKARQSMDPRFHLRARVWFMPFSPRRVEDNHHMWFDDAFARSVAGPGSSARLPRRPPEELAHEPKRDPLCSPKGKPAPKEGNRT